jgi:hypothetical protein
MKRAQAISKIGYPTSCNRVLHAIEGVTRVYVCQAYFPS